MLVSVRVLFNKETDPYHTKPACLGANTGNTSTDVDPKGFFELIKE